MPGALTLAASLLATQVVALALPGKLQGRSTYPFDYMVAFGDELSDNGNGSYAHGITGNPANVYGYVFQSGILDHTTLKNVEPHLCNPYYFFLPVFDSPSQTPSLSSTSINSPLDSAPGPTALSPSPTSRTSSQSP
jgi:hypothetical protein